MTTELRGLTSFLVLADELHFGRAAGRLSVNVSALTRGIAGLERDLVVPLFVRTSRRVTLTEAGTELALRLPQALRAVDGALAAVRATSDSGWEV